MLKYPQRSIRTTRSSISHNSRSDTPIVHQTQLQEAMNRDLQLLADFDVADVVPASALTHDQLFQHDGLRIGSQMDR